MVYSRIHTLPIYESVEALHLLPNFHHYYKGEEEVAKSDIVVASAGNKGVVKVWKSFRKQTADDDDDQLGPIGGLRRLAVQDESTAFGEKRGGYTGLLLTSHKHGFGRRENDSNDNDNSSGAASHQELIAIDAEHNISFLNLLNSSNDEESMALLDTKRTIIGHNDEILDLKIIPDDYNGGSTTRRVAVATNSAQIRIFELGSYSCNILDGHTETVLSIDVSPCGRYLASSGKDKTMRLWNLQTYKCIAIATGHTEAVGATALSRKSTRFDVGGKAAKNGGGSFVVTASKDKTLKRWNLPGSAVLGKVCTTDEEDLQLSVFSSTKAHEKVS